MALSREEYERVLDDSKTRLSLLSSLKPASHIHIICVCGTLTASIAKLLKERGFYVTGSDKAFYPPMDGVVKSVVDKVYSNFSKDNLKEKPDFVLIGNAARKDNEEVLEVLEKNIPYASMPEAINVFLIGSKSETRTSIVICGTHGKTTTTAGCATVFENAGLKPAYFIGGIPEDLASSIRSFSSEIPLASRVAILEGDEYDSSFFQKLAKFHFYRADILSITSLEFDHADIYNSIEEIEQEFVRVIEKMPEGSVVLFCDESKRLVSLKERLEGKVKARLYTYGTSEVSKYRLLKREISKSSFKQELLIDLDGEELELSLKVSGRHNALNLTLVSAIAKLSGLRSEQIKKGAEKFSGVLRREQVLYNKNGILVLEDFAHHPTAVKTTLEGLKETYPDKRILAVLEPRSNTARRHFFQKEFVESFSVVDVVYFLEVSLDGTYSETSSALKTLDFKKLVSDLEDKGKKANVFSEPEDLSKELLKQLKEGDLVVLMSNGDFRGLREMLLSGLRG